MILQLFSFQRVLALVCCAFLVSFATAGSINYTGPVAGPGGMTGWTDPVGGGSVWYGGLSESNTRGSGGDDGQTANLFGAPTGVTGNSIDFTPPNFEAQVTSTGPFVSDIVDGQLTFMVVPLANHVINSFTFSEAGDASLVGLPSEFTAASVQATLFIDILGVDNQPVNYNVQSILEFTPSDGSYDLQNDNGEPYDIDSGVAGFGVVWNGTATIDLDAELADLGVTYRRGVTKVNVTLDNTLKVSAVDGGTAFIKKKDIDGFTVTTETTPEIPEPATALLALLAVASVAGARRV